MSSLVTMSDDDFEVRHVDTGATDATSIPVNKLKKGGYVLIEGRPCRVVDISQSKPGKHGPAKANIAGTDIFTGRRFEAHLPTSHDVEVPTVDRQDYSLIRIDGKHTQLIVLGGKMREDVELDGSDVCKRLKESAARGDELLVTVVTWTKEAKIIGFRKNQQ